MKTLITLAAAAALLAGGTAPAAFAKSTPRYDRQQCFYTRNVEIGNEREGCSRHKCQANRRKQERYCDKHP